jgi:catalase
LAGRTRGLHPPGKDHPLRPRAHPRAGSSTRVRRPRHLRRYDHSRSSARAFLSEKGKRTPVFVRFNGRGERGSTGHATRRPHATKFYTDEGNFDIVGNNIPVFFIQDAIKFPDLVHALKPEPHHAMPQAASAHDTFWDSSHHAGIDPHVDVGHVRPGATPELSHHAGFGVHTFRLVNAKGYRVS